MREVLYRGGQIPDWVEDNDNPPDELQGSIKAIVDIRNNTKGVEVASPFWVNATGVLETKRILWLQMQEAARLPWMIKQVDTTT